MITIADPDTHKPLKYNILYLLMSFGGSHDIISMYEILKEVRKTPEMPDNKHKYTGIERALKELDKEGFALQKDIVKGVAYYSASPETILKIAENVGKRYKNMDHDLSILENEIQFTNNSYEILGHGKNGYLGIDNIPASRLNDFGDKIENWADLDKHGHVVHPKKTQR